MHIFLFFMLAYYSNLIVLIYTDSALVNSLWKTYLLFSIKIIAQLFKRVLKRLI